MYHRVQLVIIVLQSRKVTSFLVNYFCFFHKHSVGTVLFSALMLGATLIALHGAARVPDDLFIDDAQQVSFADE